MKVWLAFATALLILWQVAAAPSAAAGARQGIVRGDRHTFVDGDGPFLARGATLFWGLWGYQHDRERLARNFEALRRWGIDYVRVLGVVGAPGEHPGPVCASGFEGCDSWRDRRVDPTAATYARDIAAFTDWAYDKHGIRIQWTIFGGTEFTPSVDSRKAVVRTFADMARGREQKIFAFEVANESWQNGFPGVEGNSELRELAKVLKGISSNLVALSSPESGACAGVQALYRDSVADLVTLHVGRAGPEAGAHWKALRDVWETQNCAGVPPLKSSNEPIGPGSSVASLDDPVALSATAAVTYISGIGAFVLHTGSGVRGGGEADLTRGRHRNLWEVPKIEPIASGLSNVSKLLPADVSNWKTIDGVAGADRMFDIGDRAAVAGVYCATRAPDFRCAVVGIGQPVALTARVNMSARIARLDISSDGVAQTLNAGSQLRLSADLGAVLIKGTLR